MPVFPINNITNFNNRISNTNSVSFGHKKEEKCPYSNKKKAVVAATSAIGTLASMAVLAKRANKGSSYKNLFKNIASYWKNIEFHDKEIITIGAGSCLGGLLGGYLVDKNPENRKAKRRETIMQIGNISIPILTVEACAKLTKKSKNIVKTLAACGGLIAGVYLANVLMNTLSDAIFKNNNDRGVKATDFSAHVDDMVVAAEYISNHPIIHGIARIIPVALMIPGNEVGKKTVN